MTRQGGAGSIFLLIHACTCTIVDSADPIRKRDQLKTHVDVFIDYVCPYCYLVESSLDELKRDRDVHVTIRPFELRPAPVPTLRPEDEYLPRVWNQSVYPLARRLGIPMTLPSVSPQPRTEKAFLALQLAQEQGKADEYSEAMFTAFFQDDRDIGADDVIVDVATSIGLDANDVQAALNDEARRQQHRLDQDFAVNTVGITSVPGILINGHLLPGVPSAARLKKTFDELTAQRSFPRADS